MYGYPESIRPMPLSNREIIELATRLSKRALAVLGETFVARHGLPFDRVYEEYIYPEFGIRLVEDQPLGRGPDGEETLGYYSPVTNTAYVDAHFRLDAPDGRREFTRWHEVVGHGVMQREWLLSERRRLGLDRHEDSRATRAAVPDPRLEHQANLAAATFAAPEWLLCHAMRDRLDLSQGRRLEFRRPGVWNIGPPGNSPPRYIHDFEELCRVVALYIRPLFGQLSIEALSYRLKGCRFLLDASLPADLLLYRRPARRPHRYESVRGTTAALVVSART